MFSGKYFPTFTEHFGYLSNSYTELFRVCCLYVTKLSLYVQIKFFKVSTAITCLTVAELYLRDLICKSS